MDNEGSDSAFQNSSSLNDCTTESTSNDAKKSGGVDEAYPDLQPEEASNDETNGDNNTKCGVEIDDAAGTNGLGESSEHVAEDVKSSDNMKYPSNSAEPSVSVGADATSKVDMLSSTETVGSLETPPKPDGAFSPTKNAGNKMCERNYSMCLLLYKTKREKGRTLLEDKPCKTLFTKSAEERLRDVFLLPDDAEDSFMANSVEINITKSVYLAGTV
jgi:hypothetical protein